MIPSPRRTRHAWVALAARTAGMEGRDGAPSNLSRVSARTHPPRDPSRFDARPPMNTQVTELGSSSRATPTIATTGRSARNGPGGSPSDVTSRVDYQDVRLSIQELGITT